MGYTNKYLQDRSRDWAEATALVVRSSRLWSGWRTWPWRDDRCTTRPPQGRPWLCAEAALLNLRRQVLVDVHPPRRGGRCGSPPNEEMEKKCTIVWLTCGDC
jgi:hypothetical protein